MTQELRYALRVLLKSPTFTIVAIATLALGIGANTAVLSLVNGLLIKPLPYHAPQKLVLLFEQFKAQGLDRIPVSPPEFLDYKRQTTCFDGLAVFDYGGFNLTGGDVPERVAGSLVSPNVFQLLGVEPIKGRVFAESEGESGRDNVIVISARLWQRRFNSDSQLVGKQLSG